MSTEYKYFVTVIVAEENIAAANSLVACKGIGESGEGDADSFRLSNWTHEGKKIAFVCPVVTANFLASLVAAGEGQFECVLPDWDKEGQIVDLSAAQSLIDNAVIVPEFDYEAELTWDNSKLLIVVTPDWEGVFSKLGIALETPVEPEPEPEPLPDPDPEPAPEDPEDL